MDRQSRKQERAARHTHTDPAASEPDSKQRDGGAEKGEDAAQAREAGRRHARGVGRALRLPVRGSSSFSAIFVLPSVL